MSSEKYSNNASSTLNGAINNSVTSLTVTSASAFPSTGQFAIIVDSEIMIVTAVASNVFTITRGAEGTSGASHISGSVVTHILTKRAMDQIIADNQQKGLYSALPSAEKAGRLYRTTDAPYIFRDNGSSWDAFGPIYPLTVPPTSGFTWLTQSTASVVHTAGPLVFESSTNSAFNRYLRNLPAAPYTLTFLLLPNLLSKNGVNPDAFVGLCLQDSIGGNFILFYYGNNGPAFGGYITYLEKWNSSAVSQGVYGTYNPGEAFRWIRIVDDNTDRIFYVSYDGFNWLELDRRTRTNFITPDKVGVFGFGSNSVKAKCSLFSWLEQ